MHKLYEKLLTKKDKIVVVGLGYVGLPLALAFAKKIKTIGFDIDGHRVANYKEGKDFNGLYNQELADSKIEFTNIPEDMAEAKVFLVTVPTPIYKDKRPDLSPLKEASEMIGQNISKGSLVIYESTVYPGVTEDICGPILEACSGLKAGLDFKLAYSPERINPGDQINRLENIAKVVAGSDPETTDFLAKFYALVIEAEIFKLSSIKAAEAVKLAENAQRDINIAFMNELAIVFDKLDINSKEVIAGMNTKWNALGFTPGLVGGHCIGVDPYYFLYQAERLGYHSQIIQAGRKINDEIPYFIVQRALKKMIEAKINIGQSKIYILGATFKENFEDLRNSKVLNMIESFKDYGLEPFLVDPYADKEEIFRLTGLEIEALDQVKEADMLIFAVSHTEFRNLNPEEIKKMYKEKSDKDKILIDIKSIFSKDEMTAAGFNYWNL